MLQLGGHHLAYNFTFNGREAGATPLFFGSEPIRFTIKGAEHEPLTAQSTAMSQLAKAISVHPQAKLSGTFTDVVKGVVVQMDTGQAADRRHRLGLPARLSGRQATIAACPIGALTPEQQQLVRAALESYASLPGAAISRPLVAAYESPAALAQTYVGYSGATDLGAAGIICAHRWPAHLDGVRRAARRREARGAALPRAVARQAGGLRWRGRPMIRIARRALLALLCAAAVQPAGAHRAPNSILKLDFRADSVGAELLVPASELAYATGGQPSADALAAYLLRHFGAETPDGARWTVVVAGVRATTYLEHEYFRAEMTLAPPRGRLGPEVRPGERRRHA